MTGPVPPGSGWPGDLATPDTPVARAAEDVRRLAARAASRGLDELTGCISVCRACPRLVAWRETVAREKRRAFADEVYWGRPIPGWGEAQPAVLVVGLAPAAHGGNRTGRIFTGDRSGDWLFASLHRVGLAAQASSVRADDGQRLIGTRMFAAVRCAPPDNRPTPEERDTCAPWLDAELSAVLPHVRSLVALGGFAWTAALGALARAGLAVPVPRPRFGHGVEVALPTAQPGAQPGARRGGLLLLGCYHPSQQNTFTGRLTEPMLDAVLGRAASYAGLAR